MIGAAGLFSPLVLDFPSSKRGLSLSGMGGSRQPRRRELSELGRLLASANGYTVLDAAGRQLGRVDHLRYERHTDRPDEIVVRRGGFWRRGLVVPFHAIETVDRSTGTVRLRSAPSQPEAV